MSDQKEQHVIDATGKRLGRVATEVATLLLGKEKAQREGVCALHRIPGRSSKNEHAKTY